jgi:hypothetical protein
MPASARGANDVLGLVNRLVVVMLDDAEAGLIEQSAHGMQVRTARAREAHEWQRRQEQRQCQIVAQCVFDGNGLVPSAGFGCPIEK